MHPRIEALTLHRPWPWAFTHLPKPWQKDLENRSWEPPTWVVGRWIALHAGSEYDSAGGIGIVKRLQGTGYKLPAPDDHPLGIVCMARIDGWVNAAPTPPRDLWWMGPLAWTVGEVFTLPQLVQLPGSRKLWTVADCPRCEGAQRLDPEHGCATARVVDQLPAEMIPRLARRPRLGGDPGGPQQRLL